VRLRKYRDAARGGDENGSWIALGQFRAVPSPARAPSLGPRRRGFKGSEMSAATGQLTPPPTVVKSGEEEEREKQGNEGVRARKSEENSRNGGAAPAGESPSLDRLSLNRTPSRYGARVVTQSHPGLDALTLPSRPRAPSRSPAVSHRHPSIAISPHSHRRGFTAAAAAAAAAVAATPLCRPPSAPLMLRHVLSNTYTHIKIRTVNPNKREDAHSAVRARVCAYSRVRMIRRR